MTTKEELQKLKVTELKELCKGKGLSQVGNKAELVARLVELVPQKTADGEKNTITEAGSGSANDEVKTSDLTTETVKAASENTAQEPNKDSIDDAKAVDNPAQGKDEDVQKQEVSASHEQMPVKPQNVENGSDKDEKQKLIDRAKRFGVQAPELEEEKKIERAKRFGIQAPELEEEKKIERAKRFGIAAPELDEAKKRERAKRFGVPVSDDDKKLDRAKRFNLQAPELEADKMKARAQRFGSDKTHMNPSDEIKLKLRAERFKDVLSGSAGSDTASASGAAASVTAAKPEGSQSNSNNDDEERKRKRAERFATTSAEDSELAKKKQRQERFGTAAAAS